MFKTNGKYVFDAIGADFFHTIFNESIKKYGQVTVVDLFENPLLLGLDNAFLVRNERDFEEFTKFVYNRVGWKEILCMTEMFEIKAEKGQFLYILKLPDYKEL